jgi:5-methylcytosine-specific restriction endonuclease McrA
VLNVDGHLGVRLSHDIFHCGSLEPHHVTRVSDGGPDHAAHVIALCPNCHRRVHHGADGKQFNKRLMKRLTALEPSAKTFGDNGSEPGHCVIIYLTRILESIEKYAVTLE